MNKQLFTAAINKALHNAISFYAYKQPDADECQFGAQTDKTFKSEKGFYICPFQESSLSKSTSIYQQLSAIDVCNLSADGQVPLLQISTQTTTREEYDNAAKKCIELLAENKLQKIVLSRVIVLPCSHIDWGTFFNMLAKKYPSAFIFLFYTQETGAWAGASPEKLGSFHNSQFKTMALAGTRNAGIKAEWSKKDIEEQDYVTQYISNLLSSHGISYSCSEKYSRKAGNVEHLCNDFLAETNYSVAQTIVRQLHPTPALAGIPKAEAIKYIQTTESHNRQYYGGYIGPFHKDCFDFFVNLRSLNFDSSHMALFVGGGLTKKSNPQTEWNETVEKSKTLLSVLNDDTMQ